MNRRRNLTPWLSPLLELTKTNRGLTQKQNVALQKPVKKTQDKISTHSFLSYTTDKSSETRMEIHTNIKPWLFFMVYVDRHLGMKLPSVHNNPVKVVDWKITLRFSILGHEGKKWIIVIYKSQDELELCFHQWMISSLWQFCCWGIILTSNNSGLTIWDVLKWRCTIMIVY